MKIISFPDQRSNRNRNTNSIRTRCKHVVGNIVDYWHKTSWKRKTNGEFSTVKLKVRIIII